MTQKESDSQAKIHLELLRLDTIPILAKTPRPVDLLQLEITGEGSVHAIKRDRLTHALTMAMVNSLATEGWYKRDGCLVTSNMESRLDIPLSAQLAAVRSIKYSCKEEVEYTDSKGSVRHRVVWTACEELPEKVDYLLDQVDLGLVTSKVITSANLASLVFANEPQPDIKSFVMPITPPPPKTDQEISDKSRAEFAWAAWLDWMQKYAPTQLNYFDLIGHAHCHAATSIGFYAKHIHVAVGPNGGGKGTMIRLLDSVLGFAPVKIFSMDDASQEYRADQIFDSRSSLIGCHEWRFEKNAKIDAFIGAMKSATRGEAVNVRGVGKGAQSVKSKCSFFLFYNSPAGANQEAALQDAHRQMSVWDAYDRVNVAYVDWAHTAQRLAPLMFDELMWALQSAPNWIGVCVRKYFEAMDKAELADKLSFIPTKYKNERASMLYEPFQIALMQAAEIAAHNILLLSDDTIPMTAEEKQAESVNATESIGKVLGMAVAAGANWFERYNDTDWYCWLPAGGMSSAMISKRGGRKWSYQLPAELDGIYQFTNNGLTIRLVADSQLTKIHRLIRGTKEAQMFMDRLLAPTLTGD